MFICRFPTIRKLFPLLLITFLIFNLCAPGTGFISPADPDIQYNGRIDFTDSEAPIFFWPGTSVTANFNGTSLKVALEDEKGDNYFNVFIDGNDKDYYIIDCAPGDSIYAVATGLTDEQHSVMIFKRTEGVNGWTKFKGFHLNLGSSLSDAPPIPERRIEFYGNSITCGMGNEAPADSGDTIIAQKNNYMAYGAITARNLGAEYRCIARSGIGIMKSWFDLVMPDYYYRHDPANPESRWDFSVWTPDVLIINLMQNDSWLVDRIDPIPDDTQRADAYINFVRSLRIQYPDASIFCVLGVMDAVREGAAWPGYIKSAVEKMRTEYDDDNVFAYIFEDQGFYKHPRVEHHKKMAEELTTVIRSKTGW
ncbi:SGNH/GDSL hydrolase family protein [candidate division KSB1 bacterium]